MACSFAEVESRLFQNNVQGSGCKNRITGKNKK